MRSWWMSIHVGLSDWSVLLTDSHYILDLLDILDCEVAEFLNIHTTIWLFMKVKLVLWIFRKEITNFLIIDFEIRCADQELSLHRISLNTSEYILESSGHDTTLLVVIFSTSHGMSFTGTSLTIGKNCAVVAFKDIGYDRSWSIIINFLLRASPIEDIIECELLWCLINIRSANKYLTWSLVDFYHNLMAFVHFFLRHGSATDTDLDALGLWLFGRYDNRLHFLFLKFE